MATKTLLKNVIYFLLLVIAIGGLIYWFNYNAGRGRDYERLGDLKAIQNEFTAYFSKYNTYRLPDCKPEMTIDACNGNDIWHLGSNQYLDPTNSGDFRYVVKDLSDDDFIVAFSLEQGIGNFSAGNYLWTKNGIKTKQ
jgi:hypothetical protein